MKSLSLLYIGIEAVVGPRRAGDFNNLLKGEENTGSFGV